MQNWRSATQTCENYRDGSSQLHHRDNQRINHGGTMRQNRSRRRTGRMIITKPWVRCRGDEHGVGRGGERMSQYLRETEGKGGRNTVRTPLSMGKRNVNHQSRKNHLTSLRNPSAPLRKHRPSIPTPIIRKTTRRDITMSRLLHG